MFNRESDPYKIIAADINRSNTVTTLDVVLLRRIILGIRNSVDGNTSWRFVDADYDFPNPTNPWTEIFPESIKVDHPEDNRENLNFIAVKIGDVNGNAIPNQLHGLDARQGEKVFSLEVANQRVKVGDPISLPISSKELQQIQGFQGTLWFDTKALIWQDFEPALLSEEHVNLNETSAGLIPFSWHNTLQEDASEALLGTLHFVAQKEGALQEWLRLSDRITRNEVYLIDGNEGSLDLRFLQEARPEDAREPELLQNRPNPFGQQTIIPFYLPKPSAATLSFFDLSGRLLHRVEGMYTSGYQEVLIDASQLSVEGLIYYRLETEQFSITRKMIYKK